VSGVLSYKTTPKRIMEVNYMNALTIVWLLVGVGMIAAVLIIKKKRNDEETNN
jgi:hypothetical protein